MSRIYIVSEDGTSDRLVRANSQAQAVNHVVGKRFSAKAATAAEVVEAMEGGARVENAGQEPAQAAQDNTQGDAS